MNPLDIAGIAGSAVGGVFNTIGAFGQKKEAKRQLKQGKELAGQQRNDFKQTYSDLFDLANQQSLYKKDLSAYKAVDIEAQNQQKEANLVSPTDQLYRDKASQSTANYIDAASKGAKSGVDLMSLAGMAAGREANAMQDINIAGMENQNRNRLNANQLRVSSLAQMAAADARERGLEFNSLRDKQDNIQNLTKDRGLGEMDLNYRLEQEQMARQGALQDAKSAVWSGFGDIFKSIGGGIAKQRTVDNNMEMMRMQYEQPSEKYYPTPSNINSEFDSKIRGDLKNMKIMPTVQRADNRKPIGINMERPKPIGLNGDGSYMYKPRTN